MYVFRTILSPNSKAGACFATRVMPFRPSSLLLADVVAAAAAAEAASALSNEKRWEGEAPCLHVTNGGTVWAQRLYC